MSIYKGKNLQTENTLEAITINCGTFPTPMPTKVMKYITSDASGAVNVAFLNTINVYNATAVAGGAVVPAGYIFNATLTPGTAFGATLPAGSVTYEQAAKISEYLMSFKNALDDKYLPTQKLLEAVVSIETKAKEIFDNELAHLPATIEVTDDLFAKIKLLKK